MNVNRLLLVLGLLCLASTGCGREGAQPPAISTDQVSAGVPEMFKSASPELRELATAISEAIKTQDFPVAWEKLQELNSRTGLSDEQKAFVAQGLASVGSQVQKSEESGNEAAQKALEFHRANK